MRSSPGTIESSSSRSGFPAPGRFANSPLAIASRIFFSAMISRWNILFPCLPSTGHGVSWTMIPPGEECVTSGGLLSARYVIHTVGPVWRGGEKGEPDILGSCYRNCLRLAAEKGLQSIAFPSIGTGAYGYPVEEAAPVALFAVATFLRKEEKAPGQGPVVLFDGETVRTTAEDK